MALDCLTTQLYFVDVSVFGLADTRTGGVCVVKFRIVVYVFLFNIKYAVCEVMFVDIFTYIFLRLWKNKCNIHTFMFIPRGFTACTGFYRYTFIKAKT